MMITHTIKPTVDLHSGEICLREFIDDQLAQFDPLTQRSFLVNVVDTREQAIRDCLIRLGWTPPPEPTFPAPEASHAGEACEAKAERVADFDSKAAGEFMLRHLRRRGPTSSEILVEVCRIAGYKPHDDRAFGPVFSRLVRQKRIHQVGECRRRRGNGASGGRIWSLSLAST